MARRLWLGAARSGAARRGKAVKARQGTVWSGKAGRLWQSTARQGEARQGRARRLWHGEARHGVARYGETWQGGVWRGEAVKHLIITRRKTCLIRVIDKG